jgi:GntR family transcriptional regulator, transcriptional repressor for pyruvate dehydrogenase complex
MSVASVPRFEPITRQTVAQAVRDRLAASIESGELVAGQQLPSERALCEEFGVARTSVREAIQGLVSVGLVERRSNRTHVAEHLPTVGLADTDHRKDRVRELFEVRRVMEIPIAELAVERATSEQRGELVAVANRFVDTMALADFRRLDRQFHWLLAAACGNPLLAELYHKVLDALFASGEFESLLSASTNRRAVTRIVASAGQSHRAIAAAVGCGDAATVTSSVRQHLQDVEDRMVRQLA